MILHLQSIKIFKIIQGTDLSPFHIICLHFLSSHMANVGNSNIPFKHFRSDDEVNNASPQTKVINLKTLELSLVQLKHPTMTIVEVNEYGDVRDPNIGCR